jgi:hypothetical protein
MIAALIAYILTKRAGRRRPHRYQPPPRPFPHAHSLDGVEAVSWRNSIYTKHRTDLPYPPPAIVTLEDEIRDIFRKLGEASRRLAP